MNSVGTLAARSPAIEAVPKAATLPALDAVRVLGALLVVASTRPGSEAASSRPPAAQCSS
jgi:hypothetical protein